MRFPPVTAVGIRLRTLPVVSSIAQIEDTDRNVFTPGGIGRGGCCYRFIRFISARDPREEQQDEQKHFRIVSERT